MSASGAGNREQDTRPRDAREPSAEEATEQSVAPSDAANRGQSGAAFSTDAAPPGVPSSAPRPDEPTADAPTARPSDSSAWRTPPAPDRSAGGSYSGQIPVQDPASRPDSYPPPSDPRVSGAFPAPPADAGAYRSGPFPEQRDPRASGPLPTPPQDDAAYRQSGAFPVPSDDPYRSGPLPAQRDPRMSGPLPTQSGQWDADARRSGEFAAPPYPADVYRSGPQPTVQPASPYLTTRTGSFAAAAAPGAEVTGTGARRAVAAPSVGSLLTDQAALASTGVALLLVGAMVAYIAVRYSHFADQIAMHFGPAGPTAPDRIGDKRELWTIPFIVGIVLAANVALAWALYHYDRFAARLLTLGSALVGAIGWVVLLTLLHR